MNRIINGGIELGFLQAAQETGEALSDLDIKRLEYLNSLPKNTWIAIDGDGKNTIDGSLEALLTKLFKTAGGAQ